MAFVRQRCWRRNVLFPLLDVASKPGELGGFGNKLLKLLGRVIFALPAAGDLIAESASVMSLILALTVGDDVPRFGMSVAAAEIVSSLQGSSLSNRDELFSRAST